MMADDDEEKRRIEENNASFPCNMNEIKQNVDLAVISSNKLHAELVKSRAGGQSHS